MNCHLCEAETDFTCDRCEEPVCENCCVKMTIHNQINYPLCELCGDMREIQAAEYYQQEEDAKEKVQKEKERKNAIRQANYRKPENVEKRRLRKIENRKLKAKLRRKQLAEAFRIVSGMFSGRN